MVLLIEPFPQFSGALSTPPPEVKTCLPTVCCVVLAFVPKGATI